MEDCIDICVIKVKSPSDFLIREVASLGMSDEAKGFHRLIEELNKYFENDQIIKQAFTPQKGQVYAGRRPQDTNWYRVRVETYLDRRSGLHASCFLLDDGKIETIILYKAWLGTHH
ncbi:uncharacterized protein LOC135475005 [Liolophura sinensis]|uniref:uncharacterized protein LOC135475005 n=1 Tax=Liolophura sinensis TaxID=3198878 RepID=UPI0031587F99